MMNRTMAWPLGLLLSVPPVLAAPVPGATPQATPFVAQSAFTTQVVQREPVDNITRLSMSANRIYYFADLRNLGGQTVTLRWEYRGHVVSQMPFKVGGPRWRVYSLKTLKPSQAGEWKASVVNADGVTLAVNTFEYMPGPGAPSGTAPTQVNQQK